jgi:hypothetical protein
LFTFFFEKSSKYYGVTKLNTSKKKPWLANLNIGNRTQHLGYFTTEIEAAKFVNFVCKKESMKIKNPDLSDDETETFTWPLPSKKVAMFYTFFFCVDGLSFFFINC